jgi:hypothetical protein
MTQINANLETSGQRRWLYGFNVFLLVLISVVVVGGALYLTSVFKTKWDCTSNKLYSLSSYTQQLLKQVDEKSDKFELISLYPGSGIGGSEHAQQVDDLLQEYARTSKNVTVEDFSSFGRDTLEKKIRDRYQSEIAPYETTVKGFKKLADDLEKFSKVEAANLSGLAQSSNASAPDKQQILQVQGFFQSSLPEFLGRRRRDISREEDSTSPDWGRLTSDLKSSLDDFEKQLSLMANPAQAKEVFTPSLATYLEKAGDSYKAIDQELKNYVDELNKLKPMKVQDVLEAVRPNTVVVLAPTSATVIPDYSIFKDASPAGGARTGSSFEGEQAISSAILSIVQPEKVKVVFVTTTPTHPATNTNQDGWSDMADRLRQANFDVQEWSPASSPQPGMPPEPSEPPASGKGVVWIVFPPDSPNPQQMMMGMPPPSPQPVIDEVKKHLAAGGQAMFLAEANSMGPMSQGGGGYPFGDLLTPYGIDVQSKYTVVHTYPGPNGTNRVFPRVAVTRYSDSDITKPLQSLQTLFVGVPDQQMGGILGAPTVVNVAKNLPAGAEASVLFSTAKDADTWGAASYSQDATFNKDTDIASPCPLAVEAVKNKGKDDEQRIVVIGSRLIGCNAITEQVSAAADESTGRLVAYLENPGNSELINNSVLWLAGYKNMISVSAKSTAALRIKDMPPAVLAFWRWVLFAGIPVMALALGGIMYLFRRR